MRTTLFKSQIIRFILATFFLLIVYSLYKAAPTYSVANHIVISEVQLGGGIVNDEFVELYNPTNSYVNLTGWRLTRKTSTGTQYTLVNSLFGLIEPHGYKLIAPNGEYDGSVTPDIGYSTVEHLAADNTVILYKDAGGTIADRVGMGSTQDVETTSTDNPVTNGSIERKAKVSSTSESMNSGGDDENGGNGYDTFNNSSDFVARAISDPQNSDSTPESPETVPVTSPITFYAVLEGNNEVPGVDTLNDGFAALTYNFSDN